MGVPDFSTVAVSVRDSPLTDGFLDEVTVVVVGLTTATATAVRFAAALPAIVPTSVSAAATAMRVMRYRRMPKLWP